MQGGTTFMFVTGSIEAAVGQACAAAGALDVSVAGGASIAQQCLRAGLLDELQVHIAPLLLGAGVPLFDTLGIEPVRLKTLRVVASPSVTHLKFALPKG